MTFCFRTIYLFFALIAFAVPASVAAEDAGPPAPVLAVRAGVHPDFDRLVVDWPKHVSYTVHREGGHVTVVFGAAGEASWQNVVIARATRMAGFLSTTDPSGHLIVSFVVNPGALVKDFTSGDSVVLDVTGPSVGKIATLAKAPLGGQLTNSTAAVPPAVTPVNPGANPAAPPNISPAQTKPELSSTTAPKTATPDATVNSAAVKAPPVSSAPPDPIPMADIPTEVPPVEGAGTQKTSASAPKIQAPAPAGAAPSAQKAQPPNSGAPIAGNLVSPNPGSSALPVPTSSTSSSTAAGSTAAGPTAALSPQAVAPVITPALPPALAAKLAAFPDISDTPLLIASFDPHAALRSVVYQRGGYGYIVFDKKLTLALDALTAGQPAPRVPLELLDLPKASGYRFLLPPNAEIRATRTNTVWQIFVTRLQADVPVTGALVAQPDFALGARFILPQPDATEPVRMTDPVIGDDLILIPMEQPQGFSVERKMADFEILPAAQGLVIKPLSDKLIIRAVTDGIEITAEGGLKLSTSADTGASQESSQRAKAAASGKSMFDFAGWQGKPDETYTQTRQRLQQTIVDVPETERNRARLELARFYFAQGDGEEAAALLAYLVKLVPDLAVHSDFRALDGAARTLAFRPDEGLKEFDNPALNMQPEIELWQAVADAELRDWKDAEEKFSLTETMLIGYPEPFYSRFSILAVESALAEGKDREAADWLDRLESGHHKDSIDPAIEYLHGILDAKLGHAEKAEQSWKDVATSTDNLYRVRAKMALIDLGVSTRSLTPAQAADQLEALRFAWRGDDLELDILHRLGQFYVQAHNVKAGLNTLAKAVQLYPNSSMTPAIRTEMAGIFRDIFLNDPDKALSPLDALTLYQQFRNLMPTGPDGIAVMRNLAERLVQIDLLDQAAGLLQDLVKNQLQGEEKGRVSARLAAIQLLDHKPDDALQALDMANNPAYPQDLINERTFLRARALSEQQKYDEALTLIANNNEQPAKLLRADITMRAQRWTDASRALLDLIGPPPPAGVKLSSDQANWLLNCAIAASMGGDTAGLDKLRDDYSASVSSLPQNDTFRMLTEPEKTEESRDIAAAQSRITDVDMFQGFLNTYRQAGAAPGIPSVNSPAAPLPAPTAATSPAAP